MCGFLGNIVDSPLTRALLETLGMASAAPALRLNPGTGPATSIDIIAQAAEGPRVIPALWWLLLERSAQGYRPSKYTSFNTRSDKLNEPRSLGYHPYRHSRCIVPATYIIEGEGPRGHRKYHRIEPTTAAFALGGLYREWIHPDSEAKTLSCSVITLPPHPQWMDIHSRSTPLFLPHDRELLARWLDPRITDVAEFEPLLTPAFHDRLRCLPIERPGHQRPLGEPIMIC